MALSHLKIRIPLLLRNIVLRILLISTPVGLLTGVLIDVAKLQLGFPVRTSDWVRDVVFPILLILHHTLRLWPRKYWLVTCEVLVSLVEVVAAGYFFAPVLPTSIIGVAYGQVLPVSLSLDMGNGGTLLVIAVSSFMAFVFLLCDILSDHEPKHTLRPYDFSAGLCPPGRQWSFICGNFVTRKRFSTDNPFIRSVRAALAFLCLFAISALVIYALILQPVEWSGRQGIRISKITVLGGDFVGTLTSAIGGKMRLDVPPLQAVLTTPTVSTSYQYPTMTITQFATNGDPSLPGLCRNSTDPSGTVLVNCSPAYLPFRSKDVTEILITIHFPGMSDGHRVYLGLTDSIDDTLAGAEPISLIPGYNLYGLSSISMKERILSQKGAAFGIPQYRRFAVINIRAFYSDLLPSLPRNNSTTTLRIRVQSQSYIENEQEYIEGSVLDGFALVGGIWTLVNGIFAAIFGSTLSLVLFGIKPLSIYGLVHLFRPGRGSLADRGYTLSPEERDRAVGILREHLLDIEDAPGDKFLSGSTSA